MKWKNIEKIKYLTLILLIITPLISLILAYYTNYSIFVYIFFISGVLGCISSYVHEKLLTEYNGEY